MGYPSVEQITRHVNLRALWKNVTWKENIFMGSVKSVYNVLFPSSPLCSPRLDLPLANSRLQFLLSCNNEVSLPGYPPSPTVTNWVREVTLLGRDGSPTSTALPKHRDAHAHARFSILWPEVYRKIEPQRTPAPMQRMRKQIRRGVLDETHTHRLISIAAVFQHHFNV